MAVPVVSAMAIEFGDKRRKQIVKTDGATADDYTETLTINGEEIEYTIDEREVTMYVGVCIYNGQELETDPEETETGVEYQLKQLIEGERVRMARIERQKLERWNAGLPRKD